MFGETKTAFWKGFAQAASFGFGKKKKKAQGTRIDRASEPPYDGDDLDWTEHIMHLEEKHGIEIPDHLAEAYRKKEVVFEPEMGGFRKPGATACYYAPKAKKHG
jgi:acyl carrier protein